MLHVESRGNGERLIVLGGGPGFSYRYLLAGLAPLEQEFELLYLDYPGCGGSRRADEAPPFPVLVDAVVETLLARCGPEPANVLCHSFGATVLGAAMAARAPLAIEKCVLANSSPHTRPGCDAAQVALLARMSEEDRTLLGETLAGRGRPEDLLARLLPSYCGRTHDLPAVDLDFFPDAYSAVAATLGDFDVTAALAAARERLYVFGATDFISPDLFEGVIGRPEVRTRTLDGGHFLFLDARAEFCRIVAEFFREPPAAGHR